MPKLTSEYNLACISPEIAKQWHPSKNGESLPNAVTLRSGKEVWWICNEGHEWECSIDSRAETGCPYCSNKRVSILLLN